MGKIITKKVYGETYLDEEGLFYDPVSDEMIVAYNKAKTGYPFMDVFSNRFYGLEQVLVTKKNILILAKNLIKLDDIEGDYEGENS